MATKKKLTPVQQRKLEERKFLEESSKAERDVRVSGYHTGDFIGSIAFVGLSLARFVVVDPLRSSLKVNDELEIPFGIARFGEAF